MSWPRSDWMDKTVLRTESRAVPETGSSSPTAAAIMTKCPNQKDAVDFGSTSHCIVRFSDKSFFTSMDSQPNIVVYAGNITDYIDEFDKTLDDLVDELMNRAAEVGDPPPPSPLHPQLFLLLLRRRQAWKTWREGRTPNLIDPALRANSGSMEEMEHSTPELAPSGHSINEVSTTELYPR
ncbi:hypothetical protein RHSIM_Rhsim07G0195600 [Rhododendron simsii]|uniref:Uncharacterized protein n=1 Tax=Rhododendron simsii TaxID=118357 RepID=A0A834GPC5_RHOSS|nr:hypothetical protein RHSIM_Rhsim07G0195600 [Rhododendron simsii]